MRIIFLLFFVFSICSCGRRNFYVSSEKQLLINEIRGNVAVQLKEKYDLYPGGFGGQAMDQVEMLALAFDYYQPLEIEDARELLIAAVQEFLSAVNADERIRPYLANYPFEAGNVEIAIYVHKPDFSDFGPDKLCVIAAERGNLEYKIPGKPFSKTIHEETYKEVMKKRNAEAATKETLDRWREENGRLNSKV